MSDSDETDVLLLIPPDFFNVETASVSPIIQLERLGYRTSNYSDITKYTDILSNRGSTSQQPSYEESYKSSLSVMSTKRDGYPMDEKVNCEYNFQPFTHGSNMYYSTPLKGHHVSGFTAANEPHSNDQHLLTEIDKFLVTGHNDQGNKNNSNSIIDVNSVSINEFPSLTASDFAFNKTAIPQVPEKPPRRETVGQNRSSGNARSSILSLNEIWNNNAVVSQESSKIQEERLRRQHCERNIHMLQAKLLEYEQKISVAVSVDKSKEEIIMKLENDVHRLNQQLRDSDQEHCENTGKLLAENLELKNKNLFLEKELSETITVVRKLQDKNESLEGKLESLTTANQDVNEVHKKQLKDLEIRYTNSKDSERTLREQLNKLKKVNEQLKDELETQKGKIDDYNKLKSDYASLKVKTDNLSRKFTDINAQNESYKEQIKDLKAQIDSHLEGKKNILKELDIQRISLKKYYQSQLEDVVADKLKEFQRQLATVEEQLKNEAKKKERLLAERAIKQIELINQTNEHEIKLLSERYSEQESLYRLQLTNSSKTIHELEEKLTRYQSRRADIAEQLHSIMETQWQKALEILTSPAAAVDPAGRSEDERPARFNKLTVDHIDKDQLDGVRTLKSVAENETFETPVSARGQRNLHQDKIASPRDLLHNYIELLLEKSPNDLRDLEDVLCKKGTRNDDKLGCNVKQPSKPNTSSIHLNKTLGKVQRPWK